MITGKTASGFDYEIDPASLDNMELLDVLCEIDDGKAQLMPRAATLLLGAEQKKRLYDHCRTQAGNVPIERFASELTEIMTSQSQTKN